MYVALRLVGLGLRVLPHGPLVDVATRYRVSGSARSSGRLALSGCGGACRSAPVPSGGHARSSHATGVEPEIDGGWHLAEHRDVMSGMRRGLERAHVCPCVT